MNVRQAIKSVMPKGKTFSLRRQKVGLNGTHVLRVITPAWKTLPVYQRVLKVAEALDGGLSPREREKIFRVSVLTQGEFDRVQKYAVPRRRARRAIKSPSL